MATPCWDQVSSRSMEIGAPPTTAMRSVGKLASLTAGRLATIAYCAGTPTVCVMPTLVSVIRFRKVDGSQCCIT